MKFKNKKIAIGILCCLLVFMCVGLAALRTTLNIGGTSTAINTWAILIESITEVEGNPTNGNSVSAEVGQDKVSAQFKADFKAPGDYVEYNVKVVNNGSIDATLNSVTLTSTGTDADLFSFENTAVQGSKLEAGASTEFTVKITFKSEATKLPDEDVIVDLILNYVQGEGTEVGGNTPGGGTEPEKNWDFEVDESGIITAYNYDLGTDVVVPSINYEGKKITTITQQSFTPKGNVEMYYNESPTGMYVLIHETEPNFTNILNKLVAMFTMECDGDASCEEQYKSMIYACKDSNTCYNALNIEQNAKDSNIELTITSMPETVQSQGGGYIIPDPDVPLEESMVELKPTVSSLDLSNATNLTTIENNALSDVGLESVDFGDNSSVTTIGNYAFYGNNLTDVEIPSSVETIGNNAFSENQIETLTFETGGTVENQLTKNNKYSLTKLGTSASKLATTLKGVKSIGESAFSNNKIKNLIIPSTLESIGSSAFNNNQISELIIPSTLESIGSSAFNNNQISELIIPKTVTSLGSSAFTNNPIEELTIGKCTTDSCSYNSFGTSLKTLTIESGKIGNNAFNSSPNLTSVTLEEGVISIGQSAFSNCAIGALAIPDSVTTIEAGAFRDNLAAMDLILGEGITSIDWTSFYNTSIPYLNIAQCNTEICSGRKSGGNKYFGQQIKSLIIQKGEIGDYAFSSSDESTKIETIILGDDVTSIGIYAFDNNAITTIELPINLSTIGKYAFHNNLIKGNLVIPNNVETIGDGAFYNNQIDELKIFEDSALISIGSSAFKNNLISGKFDSSNNLVTIGNYTFDNNQLTEVYIDESVLEVGECTFSGNNGLKKITIENCSEAVCGEWGGYSETLEIKKGEIPSGAFDAFNGKIKYLILGDEVTSIGSNAFYGNRIKDLTIPSSIMYIYEDAFGYQHDSNDNSTLTSITIKRTETDFLANVTVGSDWYDTTLNPTITYNPS